MSSPAAVKYRLASKKAQTLRKTATDIRLRPISHNQAQVYYHSA